MDAESAQVDDLPYSGASAGFDEIGCRPHVAPLPVTVFLEAKYAGRVHHCLDARENFGQPLWMYEIDVDVAHRVGVAASLDTAAE